MQRIRRSSAAVAVAVLLTSTLVWLGASTAAASGVTFIVNTTGDTVDIDPGDGVCEDVNGDCSLRAAIMEANATSGYADVIVLLEPGHYVLTIAGTHEDSAATGDLDLLRGDVFVIGDAGGANDRDPAATVIDGNGLDRVFDVHGYVAGFADLTITGGLTPANEAIGGGIRAVNALQLSNVVVTANEAVADGSGDGMAWGGGIHAKEIFNVNMVMLEQGPVVVTNNRAEGPVAANGGGLAAHTMEFYRPESPFDGQENVFSGNVAAGSGTNRGGGIYLGPVPGRDTPSSDLRLAVRLEGNAAEGPNGEGGGLVNVGGQVYLEGVVSSNTAARGGGVASSGQLWIEKAEILSNTASERGGGIYFDGLQSIIPGQAVAISGNTAPYGGGMSVVAGTLGAGDLEISDNTATVAGGGVEVRGGSTLLGLETSALHGNSAPLGGGAHVTDGGVLTLENVTVSGNTAQAGAALAFASDAGVSEIRSATITANNAGTGAAVQVAAGASVSITESVIGAQTSGADCNTGLLWAYTGFDLDSDGTCGFVASSDRPSADPLLGPLADNGGFTLTHLPANSSPLVDAGSTYCTPNTDQRGVKRPQGVRCDIGAVELVKSVELVAPAVSSVSPNAVITTGGTTVTVTGSGFIGTTEVRFGSTAATSFTVNSDNHITAVAPARPAGLVNLWVTNPAGTNPNQSSSWVNYQDPPSTAPTVTSLTPNAGDIAGGNTVQIKGTGFLTATNVRFGPSAQATFTIINNTTIEAIAPAHPEALVNVWVTNPNGTNPSQMSSWYRYREITGPPPNIDSVTPNTGPSTGGTEVTITGSGFTGTTAVRFATTDATSFTVHSDTHLTAIAPPRPEGLVNIRIYTHNGTSTTSTATWYNYKN